MYTESGSRCGLRRHFVPRGLLLVMVLLAFLQIQCLLIPDDEEKGTRIANKAPTVRITAGASSSDTLGLDYKVLFRWNGVDVDGVVSMFQYAIDDTVTEDAWRDTTEFSARVRFGAETSDPGDPNRFSDWHTFYVRAIDNENAVSEADHRFFNAVTIAPMTTIRFPTGLRPAPQLQQTLVFRWDGEDLDSSDPDQQPVAWEYKLAPVGNLVTDSLAVIERSIRESDNLLLDTLRVGDRTAWIRVPFENSSLRLANLAPESELAFAVRAVDEAGAIEPGLEINRNYIAFIVTGDVSQPYVTMREPSVGSNVFDTTDEVWRISVSSDRDLRFTWEGDATYYGSEAGNSNYGFDIPDPEDESLVDANGVGGWIGWNRWPGMTRPITFSDADNGQYFSFWMKMRDTSGSRESERLCEVEIFVVPFTFEKLVLVLDDAKFSGARPTDLEHDTFIEQVMARRFLDLGDVERYPLYGDPERHSAVEADKLSLEYLATFQHLVWHVNKGTFGGAGLSLNVVETEKRLLSTYLSAGGRILLLGDRLASHLGGGIFGYPKEAPTPDGDEASGDYRNDQFLWEFMRVREDIVSIRTGAPSAEIEASGLVGARSLHPAFPDIEIDPAKWNPWQIVDGRFNGGVKMWEAVEGVRPIERFEGLDSLYAPVTFDTTFALGPREAGYDDAILGWRYQSTRADTLAGTVQGRIAVFDFQPFYFDAESIQDMGTSAINWLMTGRDH